MWLNQQQEKVMLIYSKYDIYYVLIVIMKSGMGLLSRKEGLEGFIVNQKNQY